MPKPLTLLQRFDRLNRRHFRGRLKRPSMVRFAKQPDPDDPSAIGHSIFKANGRVYTLIHEDLKRFPSLVELTLVHEMVHLWNWQREVSSTNDDCQRNGSRHHKRMLIVLKREAWLC